MAKVLYADKERKTDELAKRLRSAGIEVDCIDNKTEGIKKSACEIFFENYYVDDNINKLDEYDFLVVHLGVQFQGNLKSILDKKTHLHLAIVTDLVTCYRLFKHERGLVCDYNSEELIPYIKKALKK